MTHPDPDRVLPISELYERLGLQHHKAPGKAVSRLAKNHGLRLVPHGKGRSATSRDVETYIKTIRREGLRQLAS